MVKCVKCGTAWTSSGLPLCPFCGTKVAEPVASSQTQKEDRRPDPAPVSFGFSSSSTRKGSNGSALMEAPPELRSSDPPKEVLFKEVDPEPVQAPVQDPRSKPYPLHESPVETQGLPIPQAIDVPAILPVQAGAKNLPAPAKPMNGPLILGFLAFVPALMLPLTLAFESTRVLGILGFCMSGFFMPFAPIAWIAGLSAEKRCRDQGLRPARRVSFGRLLGQGATLTLIAEMTLVLIGIAALRLSGTFPKTFWL